MVWVHGELLGMRQWNKYAVLQKDKEVRVRERGMQSGVLQKRRAN